MTLFESPLWTNALLGLAAGATVAAARLALRLLPAGAAGLIGRESLALPLYPTAAVLYVRGAGLPMEVAPPLAVALALVGYSGLARLARRYILRK